MRSRAQLLHARERVGDRTADPEHDKPIYSIGKRALDIAVATVGLVILCPLFLAIAITVYLDAGRPIFYAAERTGRGGRRFYILKFRTMVAGADTGARTTAHRDARITCTGVVLRRTKFDELPQLINVLLGDMSLVGPRPELPYYTDQYQGDELLILTVRPGITDFASLKFASLGTLVGPTDPDAVF